MPTIETSHIKSIALSFLLFLESLTLTVLLTRLVGSQSYFDPDAEIVIQIGVSLLLLLYTFSLTVGMWYKWIQYIAVPFPVGLGIFVIIAPSNHVYGILVSLLAISLIGLNLSYSTKLKNNLIKFHPLLVFRNPAKGILFTFAVVGAVIVLVDPVSIQRLDFAEMISGFAEKQVRSFLEQKSDFDFIQGAGLLGIDIKETVNTEIDTFLEPYKQFFVPLIALITLGFIQFIGFFVYIMFAVTIDILFIFARRIGFFKVTVHKVEQEKLTF